MFDVLMYLFETYLHNGSELHVDQVVFYPDNFFNTLN